MKSFVSIRVHSWSPFSLLALCALVSAIVLFPGCAGYQVGNQTLYPPEIRSVYVPMFDSHSFRRNLGERLTEAVVKEIQLKTPYRVVGSQDADSVLSGRILSDTKRIVALAPTDEPRELQINFRVEVSWTDSAGASIRQRRSIPLPPAIASVSQASSLVPEVGQSVATAQQQAITRLAEQIVSLMEAPW